MALLKCTLFTVIIVTILNHNSWLRSKSKAPFDRLLGIANLYVGFHALFVLTLDYFFLKAPFYSRLAPFALLYGPFLYFAFFIILHGHISKVRVWLHSSPFVLFCVAYFSVLIQGAPMDLLSSYGRCLGLTAVLSFSCYTIWSIIYSSRPIKEELRKHKLVIIVAMVLLMFTTMVTFVGTFSREIVDDFKISSVLLRFLIYGCMLCCTLVINRFYHLMGENEVEPEPVVAVELSFENPNEGKYEKSALAETQLDIYLIKLEYLMGIQKVYLHQDLSLLKLAKLMRIPKHHLTQVLNLKIKMNFYEYVNGLRVQYACILLEENFIDTLENIAVQSGFNSKVSFNRHFKALKGVTPSEYRLSICR